MTNITPLARGTHRPADAVDDVLDGATAVELARERLHEARAVSRDDTVPHRDGRELHNLPDVSVHGLSASTPPERRRPRLHDGRLHLRVRGHHTECGSEMGTPRRSRARATLESKRVTPNLTLCSMIRRFTEEQSGRCGFESIGDGSTHDSRRRRSGESKRIIPNLTLCQHDPPLYIGARWARRLRKHRRREHMTPDAAALAAV